jgi:hypothetical protein
MVAESLVINVITHRIASLDIGVANRIAPDNLL